MAAVYLVRHGQAQFGSHNYDELSPLGYRQAQCLGAWLQACQITPSAYHSGSLQRQQQTAYEAGVLPERLQIDERLNEFDYLDVLAAHIPNCASDADLVRYLGQQSGDPRRAFQRVFSEAVAHWVAYERKIDGTVYRETWRAFQQRTQAALADAVALARASEHSVMLFTSGGVISALVQPVLGIDDARIFDLNSRLLNTGISRLHVGRQRVRLDYLNACPHLEIQRQPDHQTHR